MTDKKKKISWRTKRDEFLQILNNSNLPPQRIKEELGDLQKNWEQDEIVEGLTEEDEKKLADYNKLASEKNNEKITEGFICSNCGQKKDISELASTVPVYDSKPIKTCRECYNFYHNPPKEKVEEKQFFCAFCRREVISVCYQKRVDVSEPNELGLKKGKTYNFCSSCRRKVKDYNEVEDRDLEKDPYEIWE